ncbi:MAG: cupredoxin domain-containing protein [Candidatus Omnitrophica bacterium]|nr:cupredoxin domain-containing protein [Candidatus Omnitrophota bacterium]
MVRLIVHLVLGACLWLPVLSLAGPQETYTIVIKEHQFEPAQLSIPAGRKVKVVIDNQDPTPEEFESYELNREKVVAGGKQIILYLGPLKPGSYKYFGEFHKETAQGTIVAK